MLKGYGVGRKNKNNVPGLDKYSRFDVFTNFTHYKLPYPDFFIMDCAKPAFQLDYRGPLFDAIVCDPPYGVRARSQKVGISETKKKRLERVQQREAEK